MPGSLWRRLAAGVLDLVVVALLLALLVVLLQGPEELLRSLRLSEQESWFWLLIRPSLVRDAAVPMALGYGALCEASPLRATLGKLGLGLRVVDTEGRPATPGRAVGRNACKWFSLAGLGLGFAWMAFRADRRGWHDLLARTAVARDPAFVQRAGRAGV